METTVQDTLDCGHLVSPHSTFTTGYGIESDGTRHCYDCCATKDRDNMATAKDYVVYPNHDKRVVTNWPGNTLGQILYTYPIGHNMRFCCPTLHYYRIKATDGTEWYGKGSGNGMALRIHKAKTNRT